MLRPLSYCSSDIFLPHLDFGLKSQLLQYQKDRGGCDDRFDFLALIPGDVINSRARRRSGSPSSCAGLEGSWLERQWKTKVEARSETQPDHGGAPHRANLPSWTQWMQKRPIRQRCPCQQARHPCVKTVSECRLVARPGPCGYRSRAIFGLPYKPTSRKFRWRPEAPPVQQIRPPDRQKNGVKPVTDQGRRS